MSLWKVKCQTRSPKQLSSKLHLFRKCKNYHSDLILTDRVKNTGDFFWDVGNFYRCRLQIPQNFRLVILAHLPARVPVCLLNNAKSPIGMTDLKSKELFGALAICYRCRLQFLMNLSGKHFGWNGRITPTKHKTSKTESLRSCITNTTRTESFMKNNIVKRQSNNNQRQAHAPAAPPKIDQTSKIPTANK